MDNLMKMLMEALKNGGAVGPISLGDLEVSKMTPIGKCDPVVLKRFKKNQRDSEMLRKEMEIFIEQGKLELEAKIEEKFGERKEQIQDDRARIWDEVSDSHGISRETNMKIDGETGVVSAEIPNLAVVKEMKGTKEDNDTVH
jgi:hypothetical protein